MGDSDGHNGRDGRDDAQAGPEIPASIAAAWGLRERAGKGPKRVLSVGRIVQAATRAALTDGLAAVSMNRVASEVGTAAMSLYRYVSGKDELLLLMVDHAYGDPPEPRGPDENWRAGLIRWAVAERDVLRRHPWVLNVPISGPPITPNQVAWMEYALTCLAGTPLRHEEKLSVLLLLSGYVRSETTLSVQVAAATEKGGAAGGAAMQGYGRLLTQLIDRERFPALSELIESGALDEDSEDTDTEFTFGLERILDGVGLLIDSRNRQDPEH